MKKNIIIIFFALIIIGLGIYIGIYLNNKNDTVKERYDNSFTEININENYFENKNTVQVLNKEEKTTPNTLFIYKIFYTKCKHLINEYKDIDISEINLNRNEIMNSNKGWKIEEFSSEKVVFSKDKDDFCDEHFKLKLSNGIVTIYKIDNNDKEVEYEKTDITEEYLTEEDILKLKNGIYIYGKENLASTIEDYE